MKITKARRKNFASSNGLVVVIDVLRAFTTAAFAFANEASKILAVKTVEEAFLLHKRFPNSLLMGEVGGARIEGFHFGNSPHEVSLVNLAGKTLIQRTSSGTQGVVLAASAKHILVSSFVVAEATLQRIQSLSCKDITFLVTGETNGDEDLALADYLEERLLGNAPSLTPYLERVKSAPCAHRLFQNNIAEYPHQDLAAALKVDLFPFSMEVTKDDGLFVIKPSLL